MNKKCDEDMQALSDVINNMPFLYLQIKLIKSPATNLYISAVCTRINPYCVMLGIVPKEIIGKDISCIDESLSKSILEVINSSFKDKKEASFTFFLKKIEKYFQVAIKANVSPDTVDTFFVDTTELYKMYNQLAKTNSKLSMALDAANVTPWRLDIKENLQIFDFYKMINNNGTIIVEKEYMTVDFDEAKGRIYHEDRKIFDKELEKLIKGTITKMKLEVRIKRMANGKSVMKWNEMICIIDKFDKDHKPASLMGLSMDITERKKNELELIEAKNRAEESNILKSAFLANMSHEIRTPLNAIIGFSQVLSCATSEEERQSYIDIIETNNHILLQLIDDILDLSKIEAGTIDFNFTKVNVNGILIEALTIIRNRYKGSHVDILFEGCDNSITITTDSNRVIQIIINLMNNAMKFTDKGFVKLGYNVREKDVYIYVQDTGIGIPADKLVTIFDRFTKLNSFMQGTGLGLSICKTLVHKLGGEIGVESVEGEGSKFWFTLPRN